MSLEYFLSAKEGLVVVSFKGSFHEDTSEVLLNCVREALSRFPRVVIVHMAEVSGLPREAVRDFALFLRDIRTNGSKLHLCAPAESIRLELVRSGLISGGDVKTCLAEAIKEAACHVKAA